MNIAYECGALFDCSQMKAVKIRVKYPFIERWNQTFNGLKRYTGGIMVVPLVGVLNGSRLTPDLWHVPMGSVSVALIIPLRIELLTL